MKLKNPRKEKETRKAAVTAELERTVEDFKNTLTALQAKTNKIYNILQDLEIRDKVCPVCNRHIPIKTSICPTCGWHLAPMEAIKELDHLIPDNLSEHQTYSALYNDYIRLKNAKTREKENALSEMDDSTANAQINNPSPLKKDNASTYTEESPFIKAQKYIEFVLGVNSSSIMLKKVDYAEGDFYIAQEVLPSALCKEILPKKSGLFNYNRHTKGEFEEILKIISTVTGCLWSIPTLKQWTAAYNAKALGTVYSYDLCLEEDGQSIAIHRPDKYFPISDAKETCFLRPIIRVKDNPQLQ